MPHAATSFASPATMPVGGPRWNAAALDAGADLVVLDGTALGGPPCGITAGAAPLVRACLAQERGVGRALLPRPDDADRLAAALAAR